MARSNIKPKQSKIPSVATFNKARAVLQRKHSNEETDELIGKNVSQRSRYNIAKNLMEKMGHKS